MQIHAGPNPVADHAPLWRYVSLSTLLQYLVGKVFVPSVKLLRTIDPFEGFPLRLAPQLVQPLGTIEGDEFAKWVYENRLTDNQKECWDYNKTHPGGNWQVAMTQYYDLLETTRYAWCWLQSECESAAMWQVRGNAGAAVRTTLAKLKCDSCDNNRVWLASEIEYLDHSHPYAFLDPRSDRLTQFLRRPFLVKRREYIHEKEVRLVTVSRERRGGLMVSFQSNLWIDEIRLWPGMPGSESNAVIDAVKRLAPDLDGKITKSELFERYRIAPEMGQALDNFRAGERSTELQAWPAFMNDP